MASAMEKSLNEELYAWISTIPFSKRIKNLNRDFSDAVMMAEVLKVYYPRYVDLHNYAPANSVNTKKENWNLLNRKVLSKIDMKLPKETINQVVIYQPGIIENVLLELRNKVLKDQEHQSYQHVSDDDSKINLVTEDKTDEVEAESVSSNDLNMRSNSQSSVNANSSRLVVVRGIEKFLNALQWFISWLFIWNYLKHIPSIFRSLGNSQNPRESEVDVSIPFDRINDVITTLNCKLEYVENTLKLMNERLSQLLVQNFMESKHFET